MVFTDVSEVGHRFLWCLLEQGGYYQNIVKTPLSLPLGYRKRVFVVVLLLLVSHVQTVCVFGSRPRMHEAKVSTPRELAAVSRSGCPGQAVSASPPLRDSLLLFYIQRPGVLAVEIRGVTPS